MISCQTFRAGFAPETNDAALLEHVRACDACLDYAAQIDPDIMFRAIGGAEMVPPGGIDAFVGDVMREVRLRAKENTMVPARVLSWPQRMAIAATVVVGVSASLLVWQREQVAPVPMTVARATRTPVITKLTAVPAVETYESDNATIVEVPADEASDVKIVMVFDENLPADL